MILIHNNIIFAIEISMTIKFIQVFFIALVLLPNTSYGQNKLEKPIQIQLNFSGAFLSVAANGIADPSVEDIKVNSWKPGVSFGYHLKPYLYVGYALSPSLDLTLREEWGFTDFAKDGNIILDHKTGKIQNFEARYTPFKIGLYISAAWILIDKTSYNMQFRRKSDMMYIGINQYAVDLDVRWNSKSTNQLGIGFGYNWVLNSGISFNFGVSVPTKFPDNESVFFDNVNFSGFKPLQSDLELAEAFLNEETFYGPILLFFNVGYNLKINKLNII